MAILFETKKMVAFFIKYVLFRPMDYAKIILRQFANGVSFQNLLPNTNENNENHSLLEVVKSRSSGKATLGRCMRIFGNITGVLTVIPFVIFFVRLIFRAVKEDVALSKSADSADVPSATDEQPVSASKASASTPVTPPAAKPVDGFDRLWESATKKNKFNYCDVKILLMTSKDSVPPVKSDIYFIGSQSFDDFCPESDREPIPAARLRQSKSNANSNSPVLTPMPEDDVIEAVAIKEDSELFQKYGVRCLARIRVLNGSDGMERCHTFYLHALNALYELLWCPSPADQDQNSTPQETRSDGQGGKMMSQKSVVFANIGKEVFGCASDQEAAIIAVERIAKHCHSAKEYGVEHLGETRGAASIVILQKDSGALGHYRNEWQFQMEELETEEKAKAQSTRRSDAA